MTENAGAKGAVLVFVIILALVALILSSSGKFSTRSQLSQPSSISLTQKLTSAAAAGASTLPPPAATQAIPVPPKPSSSIISPPSTNPSNPSNPSTIISPPSSNPSTIISPPSASPSTTGSATASDTATSDTTFRVQLRYPTTTIGDASGPDTIIDLKDNEGNYDAGFVCKPYALSELLGVDHSHTDSHLVSIEPVVTNIPAYGSIVHHMDIFACQHSVMQEYKDLKNRRQHSRWCSHDSFLDTSCKRLLWVYDRGAKRFELPKNVGMLFGPSSGFDSLVLQMHYLLPKKFIIGQDQPLIDSSGFELVFDHTLRKKDAAIIGFLDFTINVPPGENAYVFTNHIDSMSLATMVSSDFLEYGKIIPFAVHLHAHDHTIAVRLEHYRGSHKLKTYDYLKPFHGYGDDQTFRHLPKDGVEPILPGDSLSFICTFSNPASALRPIVYGVSHGDEMCAPILMYYPHSRGAKGYNVGNMASFEESKTRSQDVDEKVVMEALRNIDAGGYGR